MGAPTSSEDHSLKLFHFNMLLLVMLKSNYFYCASQAKPERTAEESDRLRKLMLEWQFQKRLQESKQGDEDEEEEEDDEDMDTMLIMQRLEAEKRARVRITEVTIGRGGAYKNVEKD